MNDEFIGTVALFPYDAIPYTYLKCDGRVFPRVRYGNLFTLLGDTFGGDGVTTFGIPNLGIRVPVGAGPGQHGLNVAFGETTGYEWTQLTESNLAAHTHPVTGQAFIGGTEKDDEDSDTPKDAYLRATSGTDTYASEADAATGTTTFEVSFNNTGGNLRVNNMQPTIAMVYAICWDGTMPIRS